MRRVGSFAAILALLLAAGPSASAPPAPVVAVVDSGIVPGAPELAGRLLPGIDLAEGDADPTDTEGHGTVVATVVARACGSCAILPVRVVTPDGSAPWERVARGIVWAVDNGARVVNVSIAESEGTPELAAAVRYADERGALVVAAAGNAGDERPQFPAAYPGVLAVAAVDGAGRLYDWSSRGGWTDAAAPGCARLDVLGDLLWACGTSFAAPWVAGAAGAALAADPSLDARTLAVPVPRTAAEGAPAAVHVSGSAVPGRVLRATTPAFPHDRELGERVAWFRCRATARARCTLVGEGGRYRIRPEDAGAHLVARLRTVTFGGLWLASSPRVPVRALGQVELLARERPEALAGGVVRP